MLFKKILYKICKVDEQKWLTEAGIKEWPGNHWGDIRSFEDLRSCKRYYRIKKKTGVDPRDCYDLSMSLYLWLYSHLCQLVNDTNCDLTAYTFKHNGKTYTEGEYIEYLKELLLKLINFDEFEGCPDLIWDDLKNETSESLEEDKKEFMDIWKKNHEKIEIVRREMFDVLYELLPRLWW